MATLAHQSKYRGGVCYAACQDVFNWFNPSIHHCRRGCDFATGRVNDPQGRIDLTDMCRRYSSELYKTGKHELDGVKDLRIHADMYPKNAANVYRACLAGTRRQKF